MEQKNLIHSLDNTQTVKMTVALLIFLVVIILGVTLGFSTVRLTAKKQTVVKSGTAVNTATQVGINDKNAFKDNAEGVLQEGGIGDEGSFHLVRPGGADQTAYLTSTTVDLSGFIGKKVRVWGKTLSGKQAGWLMDVGLVETVQ